jgi:hypothetical protein
MGIPTLEKFFFSIGRSGHAPQVSDAHPLSFYSFLSKNQPKLLDVLNLQTLT